MNKRRITLMVIAIAASVICLGFMGLRAFTTKIYDSRSCEWANIDNIELRAKIDIPAQIDCQCQYDEITETKQAIITLDKKDIPADYVTANKLKKLEPYIRIEKRDFILEKNPAPFTSDKKLYYREGKNRGSRVTVVHTDFSTLAELRRWRATYVCCSS